VTRTWAEPTIVRLRNYVPRKAPEAFTRGGGRRSRTAASPMTLVPARSRLYSSPSFTSLRIW
jgi:hypothetical protein